MAAPVAESRKSTRASLIGGIAVGIAVLALWSAIARDLAADTPPVMALGVLAAIGVAAWIRLAEL